MVNEGKGKIMLCSIREWQILIQLSLISYVTHCGVWCLAPHELLWRLKHSRHNEYDTIKFPIINALSENLFK